MKKTYIKPDLMYESFVLSQSVAACYFEIDSVNIDECVTEGDVDLWVQPNLFSDINERCTAGSTEVYCYTTGTGDMATYQS